MFNLEEFDIKLDTEFIGRNFVYVEEIDSTNTILLKNNEYRHNGTTILAEYQLHGKGRRSRNWIAAKEQALTFSILLSRALEKVEVNVINLGASLAVAQAIENLHQLKVEVKWPNDVLVEGKKIAGILLESISKGSKLEKIVVGIGINVNQPNFKGKFEIPPTSIRMELKRIASRERLLSEVLNIFEEIVLTSIQNKKKILNDWRAKCKLIGEKIIIVEGDEEKFGVFEDIDDNGFLLLKSRDNRVTIYHGDVSLRTM